VGIVTRVVEESFYGDMVRRSWHWLLHFHGWRVRGEERCGGVLEVMVFF